MQTHLQYPSTDGIQLDGVLLETEVPKRAVLMLHGINSSKEEPLYPLFADRLLPLGINSFRFDFLRARKKHRPIGGDDHPRGG